MNELQGLTRRAFVAFTALTALFGFGETKKTRAQPKKLDKCNICGAEVLSMVTNEGKHIRLNIPPQKGFIIVPSPDPQLPSIFVAEMKNTYTAHVWTCPGIPTKKG